MTNNQSAGEQSQKEGTAGDDKNGDLSGQITALNVKLESMVSAYKAANARQSIHDQKILAVNRRAFWAVVIYAFITLGIFCINIRQLYESAKSADAAAKGAGEIGKQTPELIKAANAAADAAKTSASQLAELIKQTPALIDAAKAAQSSAETARMALIDVQRPILMPSVTKADIPSRDHPIDPNDSSSRQLSAEITLKNLGTEIATIEHAEVRLWAESNANPIPKPESAEQFDSRFAGQEGVCLRQSDFQIVLPESTAVLECQTQMDASTFRRYAIGDYRLILTVFIKYRDAIGILRELGLTWFYSGRPQAQDNGFYRYRDKNGDYDRIVQQ